MILNVHRANIKQLSGLEKLPGLSRKRPLAPVVQNWLESAFHWRNIYPENNAIVFLNTYPLDSDVFSG